MVGVYCLLSIVYRPLCMSIRHGMAWHGGKLFGHDIESRCLWMDRREGGFGFLLYNDCYIILHYILYVPNKYHFPIAG